MNIAQAESADSVLNSADLVLNILLKIYSQGRSERGGVGGVTPPNFFENGR